MSADIALWPQARHGLVLEMSIKDSLSSTGLSAREQQKLQKLLLKGEGAGRQRAPPHRPEQGCGDKSSTQVKWGVRCTSVQGAPAAEQPETSYH